MLKKWPSTSTSLIGFTAAEGVPVAGEWIRVQHPTGSSAVAG